MTSLVPYTPLPIDQSDVRYEHGPDSVRQPGVHVGQTVELTLTNSVVYPGTSRRVWVHYPQDTTRQRRPRSWSSWTAGGT